jgi:hypothetical protein
VSQKNIYRRKTKLAYIAGGVNTHLPLKILKKQFFLVSIQTSKQPNEKRK